MDYLAIKDKGKIKGDMFLANVGHSAHTASRTATLAS
jgi:hypothetical protein